MVPPIPPEEIAQLMRFIAVKAKNVTSPMNVTELCRQFQRETGSLVSLMGLTHRIKLYRDRIHEMNEFNTETKVKMIFALSASINVEFLIRLKRVAEVKVDDKRRILQYNQKDGKLKLSGKHSGVATNNEELDKTVIQFLSRKSETTNIPIADKFFLTELKKKTGCTGSVRALEDSYQRVKRKIYQTPGIDEKTRIKMFFISNAQLPDDVLEEFRRYADVEVDEEGRITKYTANDGSLKLEGRPRLSTSMKSFGSDRWQSVCEEINKEESEEDEEEDLNRQRGYEKKRIDLIKFLIKRTKDAKYPMSIPSLAASFKTEFKSSDPLRKTEERILSFRLWIHEVNQFDMSTKVKMMFALSAPVDARFLKEIQKDAFVELDEMKRIKTYIANDGSLELERDHMLSLKIPARETNASSGSKGEKYSQSTSLSQNLAAIQKGRKRVRQISEEDGESLKLGDNWSMDFDANHVDNVRYDYCDFDPPCYEEYMDPIPEEKKPENLIEGKTEVQEMSSASIGGDYGIFEYGALKYEEDLEHVPTEEKPESLIEVKAEIPEQPSTSNSEYHYEDNMDHILIEPKPEIG